MIGLRILEDVPLPVRLVRNVRPSVEQDVEAMQRRIALIQDASCYMGAFARRRACSRP